MRKIASHYWMRPDGSIGKFPVLVFDNQQKIVEIRERTVFKEEAGLELVNGFLVPAFVDFMPYIICQQDSSLLKTYLNQQIISGTKVLGTSEECIQKTININLRGVRLIECKYEEYGEGTMDTAFMKIQKSNSQSIEELLHFTIGNAKKLNVEVEYGTLQIGKMPGLLSISNLDYNTFEINLKSKLKIII